MKRNKIQGYYFFIAVEDRKFRLETGYGVEGIIPDLRAKQLLDLMTPDFKNGDYSAGVTKLVNETSNILLNDIEFDPSTVKPKGVQINDKLLFFGFMIFSWLGSILGKK